MTFFISVLDLLVIKVILFPTHQSLRLQANYSIMSVSKHPSDVFRNYQDDRDVDSKKTVYTTSNGVPMPHPYETQRVGENGPLLLQDFHLIDLISHFDRERIPERVVHAKGGGAHGFYKTTEPVDDLCLADIFSAAGKECPITIRFSTVGGESGSHDLARDPRGFSVKFKTDEGNWDLVANNTPVFFLRDPAKFPSVFISRLSLLQYADTFPAILSIPRNAIQRRILPAPMTLRTSGTIYHRIRSRSIRS